MFLPLAATVLKTKVEVGIFQYQRNLLISSDRLVFLESPERSEVNVAYQL
jgi:hypothetical protein